MNMNKYTGDTERHRRGVQALNCEGLQLSDIDQVIYPVWAPAFITWPQQFVVSEDVQGYHINQYYILICETSCTH